MGGFNASAFNQSQDQERSGRAAAATTHNEVRPFATPIPPRRFQFLASKFSNSAQRLWASLVQGLIDDGQPQVKWWRDAQGNDHYSVYDPPRQQTHDFATAHEVRVWLEQRYYE